MRLATIRVPGGTRAVRLEGDHAVELGHPDVGSLLRDPGWREAPGGAAHPVAGLDFAPVVPRPEKIVCVGLNYRPHILEMGRELPEHPTLFTKFARALVGAYDPVQLPAASAAMDWEAELAVVVGSPVRHADPDSAAAAIAGYTVLNDVTARDWQYRTTQWLPGKTFEATTPVGPWLSTDPLPAAGATIECLLDGEVVQRANTAELVFSPVDLIRYLSAIVTLEPGDLIATGTPGGVGHARKPPRYLTPGSELVTRIEGVGECRNPLVAAPPAR